MLIYLIMLPDETFEETFLIKMAISSHNEKELMKFISAAIDDEDQSLSFDNFISLSPELMMESFNPIIYMLKWRIDHWGVAHNCDQVIKDVQHTEKLFGKTLGHNYVEYLQFTTLFNVPVKLFIDLSNYFEDLAFDMIFIKNNLEMCGRVTIKCGEIIDQTIITDPDAYYDEFLLVTHYMYDDNYENELADRLLESVYL